jgi:hypothetical protein
MSIAGPLALKVLAALGIGTVVFTGVSASLQALIDMAVANWGGMSADVLALAAIAGVPQCLGIITGAMTARVGMWAAVSATKWVTT